MKLVVAALVALSCVVASPCCVIAGEKLSPSYEKHRILEDVSAGRWAIRGTSDGKEMEGRLEGKWAPEKYCVVFSGYFQPVGSTNRTHLSGIIGWDNETGRIREQIFLSDGSSATALFEVRGKELVGKRNGVKADGAKYSQDLRFSIGKGRWVGAPANDVGSNGQVLAKHGEWVFARIGND